MFNFIENNFFQVIRFALVGVFNSLNSLIIYYILLHFNIHYFLANFFAYIFSCVVAYGIQKGFVFKSNKGSKKRYYAVYLSSFFINMVCIYLWVDVLHISSKIAPLLTLFFTVPYNFLFSKYWTFKNCNKTYSHTFVICAYGECCYLEECILSLYHQTIFSNIIIVTSTDNSFIRLLANKYKIKLYVRRGKSDIQDDWNFGYRKAKTDLVTIVHQDDVYRQDYLEEILKFYKNFDHVLFVCTDYCVLKNGMIMEDLNGKVKKFLKLPLRFSFLNQLKFFKIFSLAFGSSINCQSVTYNKLLLGKKDIFTSELKFSLDWDTFLKFAKQKGRIGYISKNLIFYRIHNHATTVKFINSDLRKKEDIIMFSKIWPSFVVKIIMKFYVKANSIYDDVKDIDD